MPVHENELNVRIAGILSESFGLDCRPERPQHRARPDIRCYYNGLRVSIEASYSATNAERDAVERVKKGLADIALALHYTREYPDVPEKELKILLKESNFNIKIIAPKELAGLERYILGKTRVAEPRGGWFRDVRLESVADFIRHAAAYIVEETEIEREVERVKQVISDFINVASSIQSSDTLREKIANILYRLYGFSVAETRDVEVVFGQAALAILLSTVFYERLRHVHGLQSVEAYIRSKGNIHGLKAALGDMLKINYEPALQLAIEILNEIPPVLSAGIGSLINCSLRISEMSHLLARDFAGRIYHEITGDISVRKGFATFYTEVPAAYMLTNLALKTALNIDNLTDLPSDEAKRVLDRIAALKIADFACGSGTLLTASLYNASRITRTLCFLNDLEYPDIEKKLIEEGTYGLDALRYAAQITAINLALLAPPNITKENINAIYLGYIPNRGAWLGSLELLEDNVRVGGLLQWLEGGLKGLVERVSITNVESGKMELPSSYDVIVMNPPFTRATGRVSEEFEEGRKGLFGFIADEDVRKKVKERYDRLREIIREDLMKNATDLIVNDPSLQKSLKILLPRQKGHEISEAESEETGLDQYFNIGQAGEGLPFLYLAYKYVKPEGAIAFVIPRNILSGISWFLARALLATKFHLKYVIVSSDSRKGYNFSEGASFSEALIVAKRVSGHNDSEETFFIDLLEKPKTALEALLYADGITESIKEKNTVVMVKDKIVARMKRVQRRELLDFIVNWGTFFMEDALFNLMKTLIEQNRVGFTNVPIVTFNDLIVDMGVNRGGDVIEAFNLMVSGGRVKSEAYKEKPMVPYIPMVCGSGKGVAKTIEISPNAYVPDATGRKAERIKTLRTKLLVPNRIRWNAFHAVAHLVTEPVISNVYFMVKTNLDDERLKALVLWLNSFWGLLSIYSLMEVTEEAFTRLNIGQWKLLPVLDVRKLDEKCLAQLSAIYNRHKDKIYGSLIDQFKEHTRLELDLDMIKCLNIQMDKDNLVELYNLFYLTLSRMSRKQ